MLDAVSLDQLRTFIAAVDEGSFSAASRKLLRAQSVVSETISKLEEQIGVQLFDRTGRYPKLTAAGSAVVGDARSIIAGVDLLKARAKGMSAGLEPELSVVIDVFYPIDAITQVAKEFRQNYPGVALRIYVEALGGAIKPVLDGRCSIGVIGSLPVIPDTLTYERLPGIAFLMVAARDHALASYRAKFPRRFLENILRSSSPTGRAIPRTRIRRHVGRDLAACRPLRQASFLLKGLGWGGMPLHGRAQGSGRGAPCRAADRGRAAGWLDAADVGGVADQVAAWTRRPVVCRSPEAISGGYGQGTETASQQEEGRTVCQSLVGAVSLITMSAGACEAGRLWRHHGDRIFQAEGSRWHRSNRQNPRAGLLKAYYRARSMLVGAALGCSSRVGSSAWIQSLKSRPRHFSDRARPG